VIMDRETGEWLDKLEVLSEIHYVHELRRHYRKEIEGPKKVCRGIKFLDIKNGEKSTKKIEKVNFSETSIVKSRSGDSRMLEPSSQVEVLPQEIAQMAEQIDELRSKIRNQDLAIIVKDQHISNLNRALRAKDHRITNLERLIRERDAQHYQNLMNLTKEIVQTKKYSVFYNLLSRFRRQLLKFLGRTQK